MKKDIHSVLEIIKTHCDEHIFSSGNCHDLAFVLKKHFGGNLSAIMRNEVDEDDVIFSTTYSHMILEVNGESIDIDGSEADERWESMWPDVYDEDGLMSEFDYVIVEENNIKEFLNQFQIVQNLELINKLDALITA